MGDEMLEAAKARMEQEDLDQGIAPSTSTSNNSSGAAMILGGFLSPSHDLYVGEKLKGEDLVLNSRERLDLCRLQTADSDWIDVDAWEASQDRFYDYNKVTSRLQQFLQERCHTALQNRMNALLSKQQSPVVGGGSGEQLDEKSYASMVPQRSGSLTHSLTNNNNSTVNNLSQSAAGRNPYNIRVVYLCGADFVLRTGARKLVGGIVVVDRPLGAPSSSNQRRSILLTQSGGSISVPVSNQIEDPSSSTSGASASNSTTTGETAKQRVFKRLEQSYGSEWCEASRNNIWWLPARSRTESEDISSTRIRGLLSDRKSCKGLLHPAVAQRLLEKKARQDAGL
ncbi:hypothetical protein K457DRAFT_1865582 [Linnemannia elongata AG-77]|uniref:Cytidyltransferase-like domain-containing protein n=1 Tax=Linnemannia elongata AG-77 TaxID=1314771 RepID=A0A197JT99_9FUNG|nr:hypothetical protein K457DRAFT_1865582 [Linnemannia elongata AG-77]